MTDEIKLTIDEKLNIIMARLSEIENRVFNLSQAIAEKEYGPEVVVEALEACKATGQMREFVNFPHPYDTLVKWHIGATAH